MGECGCIANSRRHKFPGPGQSFYILTLDGPCTNCDAPPGISIEKIMPGMFMHSAEHQVDFLDGDLKFEPWPDSQGVAVICGLRRHDFVANLRSHLIGVDSKQMGNGNGLIDAYGADVILEEMYMDSQSRPELLESPDAEEVTE